jgi:hypothetical protein
MGVIDIKFNADENSIYLNQKLNYSKIKIKLI